MYYNQCAFIRFQVIEQMHMAVNYRHIIDSDVAYSANISSIPSDRETLYLELFTVIQKNILVLN